MFATTIQSNWREKRCWARLGRVVLLMVLMLSIHPLQPSYLRAQSARFFPLGYTFGPESQISFDFFLNDAGDNRIGTLAQEDLTVTENGLGRPIVSLSCPVDYTPERISSVLTIDISTSMANHGNIDIARQAANAWIDGLPLGYSESAVVSFNEYSYLNQDFTIDRTLLHDAVNGLSAEGGTSYDAALIDFMTGALVVAGRGAHKRVVVFLTDGQSSANRAEILRIARASDVVIYSIVLQMSAPQVVREMSEQTGGEWFDNVKTKEEAMEIFRAILRLAQGDEPCRVTWERTDACEPDRDIVIAAPPYNAEHRDHLTIPATNIAAVESDQLGVRFGEVTPGSSGSRTVRLIARNRVATISSISLSNPRFRILQTRPSVPAVLYPGESIEVDLEFSPTDSSYQFDKLLVESDACNTYSPTVTGGWPGIGRGSSLTIETPNGGEKYGVGSRLPIEWKGVDPRDTVRLEFSADGGKTWRLITDSATGLHYDWIAPPPESHTCLIRAILVTTNGRRGHIVLPKHPTPVWTVQFNRDGTLLATGGEDDTIRIWNTADGSLVRTIGFNVPVGAIRQIDFSIDNQYVIGNATSGKLLHWDAATNIDTVYTDANSYYSSRFLSLTGEIVSIGSNGSNLAGLLIYQNRATLAINRTLPTPAWGNQVMRLSEDESTMIAGANDTRAYILEALSGAVQTIFTGHFSSVSDVDIDLPGDRAVSSGLTNRIYIWSTTTGQTVAPDSITLETAPFGLRMSPDRSQIAVVDFSATPSIFDSRSGFLLNRLVGHTNNPLDVDWTAFGSSTRLATAGKDSTAIIWRMEEMPKGIDQSDATFSIVDIHPRIKPVDMGRVEVGRVRDSVVGSWICNDGELPLELDSLTFPWGPEFELVSPTLPVSVAPGKCLDVEFRFRPVGTGNRFGIVRYIHSSPPWEGTITGEGVETSLELGVTDIDFGKVTIGDVHDTIVSLFVTNTSSLILDLSGITLIGPDTRQFSLIGPATPTSIGPGESASLPVRFSPFRKGLTSAKILVPVSGIADFDPGVPPLEARVLGEGVCPDIPPVSFGVASVVEYPTGTRFQLPVTVEERRGTSSGAERPFTMVVRFNATVIAPLDSVDMDVVGRHERVVILRGLWNDAADTLIRLNLLAALGESETSPIIIESITFEDGCAEGGEELSGRLLLTDICRDGGIRLFHMSDSFFLRPVVPNPVHDATMLRCGLIEEGEMQLAIYDTRGALVREIAGGWFEPGEYLFPVQTSEIGSGTYRVVLSTPNQRRSTLMQIVR